MSEQIRMADLAVMLGCHQTTVSRALRGDPRIPKETRDRISAKADELGYRPHPLVSALIHSRRKKGGRSVAANLVYLTTGPLQSELPEFTPLRQLFQAIHDRAAELGYQLSELSLSEAPSRESAYLRILKARGVRGVVVGPTRPPHPPIRFPWKHFPAVVIGYWLAEPLIDRVGTNHHESIVIALRKCHELGYRRIGFCLAEYDNRRTNGHEIGGYMAEQFSLPKGDRVPPLLMETFSPSSIAAWMKRHQPEVVISSKPVAFRDCLADLGLKVPQDVALVGIGNDFPAFFARVERDYGEIGRIAADVIVRLIHRNQLGPPRNTADYLVNPRWVAGRSVLSHAGRRS